MHLNKCSGYQKLANRSPIWLQLQQRAAYRHSGALQCRGTRGRLTREGRQPGCFYDTSPHQPNGEKERERGSERERCSWDQQSLAFHCCPVPLRLVLRCVSWGLHFLHHFRSDLRKRISLCHTMCKLHQTSKSKVWTHGLRQRYIKLSHTFRRLCKVNYFKTRFKSDVTGLPLGVDPKT